MTARAADVTFSASCTHCHSEVLSAVAHLGDIELGRMREHLRKCAPSVAITTIADTGALLHHFQVRSSDPLR